MLSEEIKGKVTIHTDDAIRIQIDEENLTELDRLRKENQRLLVENDILKQAALIMG